MSGRDFFAAREHRSPAIYELPGRAHADQICDAMALAAVRRIHEQARRSDGSGRMSQALRLLGHDVGLVELDR
ncbi:hypothetical protein WT63_15855 [Burkholderia anthina]|nr:hypothetical protein WT63_15855 [Burkholderia anthina]